MFVGTSQVDTGSMRHPMNQSLESTKLTIATDSSDAEAPTKIQLVNLLTGLEDGFSSMVILT